MIRFLTAGESHGPALTAIVEGLPAGLAISPEDINHQLRRRQKGYGSGGRMSIEKDRVRITSGVVEGRTTGAPVALHVENRDYANWQEKTIAPMSIPRPGHADLTGALKYGYPDLRYSLERASARETAMRVVVGAFCRKLLEHFGVMLGGYVVQIGGVCVEVDPERSYKERFSQAESNDLRSPVKAAISDLRDEIFAAKTEKDTLGGIVEIVALGLPPGLGSHVHYDRRLDGQLVGALVSIPAFKGAEIGAAFDNATRRGSEVHDPMTRDKEGTLHRTSNRAGGLEGGITNGQPLVLRAAMKPISTVLKSLPSVNLASGEEEPTVFERSDFCALPRAVPIAEAMVAFVLANALLDKLGGDSLAEMTPRFEKLAGNRLEDFSLRDQPWSFGYPHDS